MGEELKKFVEAARALAVLQEVGSRTAKGNVLRLPISRPTHRLSMDFFALGHE